MNERDKIFKKQSFRVIANWETQVLCWLSRTGLAAGERIGVETDRAGGMELNIYWAPTMYQALLSILHPYCM